MRITVDSEDLKAVIDYLWHDEQKDYEASTSAQRRAHIFNHIDKLNDDAASVIQGWRGGVR